MKCTVTVIPSAPIFHGKADSNLYFPHHLSSFFKFPATLLNQTMYFIYECVGAKEMPINCNL